MRSGRTLSVVAAVLLSGLAVGCSKGSSRDALDEYRVTSEDAESSLSMTVSVDAATVALGDDIVFRVKLTNDGDAVTDVGVPRIDRRSLRLRITKDGGRVVVVERLHGDIDPTTGRFIPSPGASRQLEPGASFETEIRTPAVATGAYRIVATLDRPGQAPLVGDPLDVAVTPKDGRSGLGVRIATSKGDVLVRMRPDLAYNHVESFVSLVKQGFYDGLKFHRVIPGFMAQGGDPKGDGSGGPGYLLPLEAHSKLYHDRGILSMARMSPPDTAGSQFFLMFTRYPSLDPGFQRQPGYTVFGKMVEGDATLDALEAQGSAPEGRTRELLRIESMRVELLDSAD